jgi:nudix-type nucleoside diphosphatase (YffH/AdpP family)
MQKKLLSENWGKLEKVTYDFRRDDEIWETQVREVYDRGNGATILLYNTLKKTVLLTRQFRLPTFLNGNQNGMMIETCAGKLDEADPEKCIIREVEEETGYKIPSANKVFELYMSPGSVTEIIYFYVAPYDESMKVAAGGGLQTEQENIEVLEVSFSEALEMVKTGAIKDGKTIILLQHCLINHIV